MPIPKSLKRFFAVLEPGSNASKYQPEDQQKQQQQQQQKQHTNPQDKKTSTTIASTTVSANPPAKTQPDASYLMRPTTMTTTQAFWASQDASNMPDFSMN
ncbi:hypothetical protein FBU30_006671 [Linnemannia zychae]|nr:hypothetical protein FBU30_006671 [Linnemannia zychae]